MFDQAEYQYHHHQYIISCRIIRLDNNHKSVSWSRPMYSSSTAIREELLLQRYIIENYQCSSSGYHIRSNAVGNRETQYVHQHRVHQQRGDMRLLRADMGLPRGEPRTGSECTC